MSGAVPGQTFQVEAVFNYEGIPETNQFQLVSTRVSRDDPISYSNTMNHVSDMNKVRAFDSSATTADMVGNVTPPDLGPSEDDKPIKDFHPAQDKSMLETIVDGVSSGFKDLPKLVEKAAPFLEALL